jgi:hypothetical protein
LAAAYPSLKIMPAGPLRPTMAAIEEKLMTTASPEAVSLVRPQ